MNKIYFILGASSEVGMAYIKYLLTQEEDSLILAHYRSHSEEFDTICKSAGCKKVLPLQADLSKEEEVNELITQIKTNYGIPTQILHLPASKLEYRKIKQTDWKKIEEDFSVQVISLGKVLQAFLPEMAKRRYGKVAVMLSSVTFGMPPRFMTSYAVSKYALLGLMKSAAMEYADKGITVNGISPGMMETKFLENVDERLVEMTGNSSLRKRNMEVVEIIPTIHYLLSDASNCMNGVNVNLSGGDR